MNAPITHPTHRKDHSMRTNVCVKKQRKIVTDLWEKKAQKMTRVWAVSTVSGDQVFACLALEKLIGCSMGMIGCSIGVIFACETVLVAHFGRKSREKGLK